MASQHSAAYRWLDERFGLNRLQEFIRHKTVPVHRGSIWYYFGGVSLFLFAVQVLSGILLLLYYRVGADSSYESVQFLITKVPFGWLVRSIHSWGANLMVLTALIHMFSVFFERAYVKPRELTWVTGFVLLALAMGFGFSGYLLPWNKLAYFATKVGTDIVGVIPGAGNFILRVLRGSEDVTGATLARFFGLHAAILPLIFSLILAIHLFFVQTQGMSEPHVPSTRRKPPMPFFPNFLLRDLLLWLLVLNLLALLAVFFPWELGEKADPFAPAPPGIKPEWYFLGTYQLLKFIPGHILGIEGELLGVLGIGLGVLLWMLFPFLDRWDPARPRKLWIIVVGVVALTAFTVLTILGWVLA